MLVWRGKFGRRYGRINVRNHCSSFSWPVRTSRLDSNLDLAKLRCTDACDDITPSSSRRLTALAPGDSNLSIQAATLSFFLLPSSQDTALSHLKQCLHYDPDSKQCRKMLKSLKGMQKGSTCFFYLYFYYFLESRADETLVCGWLKT